MAYLYDEPCILVGGAPRSGTTLVGMVLASHPRAAILLEERLTNVVLAVERLCSIRSPADEEERAALFGGPRSFLPFPLWENEANVEKLSGLASYGLRFRQLFKSTFEIVSGKNNTSIVGSKLPIGIEWEDIDFLWRRLSDLRVILIVRNPLDVISSSLVRGKNASLGLDEWPVRNIIDAYDQWLISMIHMDKILNSAPSYRILLVKYEDLCNAPEREERRIWAFASLPPENAAVVAQATAKNRSILSDQDLIFLRDELGEVDSDWPELTAEQAIRRYSRMVRHLPFGEASLENGAFSWALVSGFADAEDWGRWTDGPRATLRFRCADVRSGVRLSLDVAMARIPPGQDGAPLVVRINGGEPRPASAKPGERLNIDMLRDEISSEVLNVELGVLEPKPPGEAPVHDPRRLGIALTGLSLHPI